MIRLSAFADEISPDPTEQLDCLAANGVGETCMSTPAIADGLLFVRTERHLIAFGRTAR